MENTRNQNEIGRNEILVISFGTSYNQNRAETIGAIEDAIEQAFPDWSVRRAFTSKMILKRVAARDGIQIDHVKEALERAVSNGVRNLVVQPTHLMDGIEYEKILCELKEYQDKFEKVSIGTPLLTSKEDYQEVIRVLTDKTKEYNQEDTAICFMGHGTEAAANKVYNRIQEMFGEAGWSNYYIGTVEASPTLEDVIEAVKKGSYQKVVLQPLMVVAGDHANNDMAGNEEDSWKSCFEAAGYDVTCCLYGLGGLEGIQNIYIRHIKDAIYSMK